MRLLSRSISSSNGLSGLGTTGYDPILSLPNLPSILTEWTSLVPLVAHLASYEHDYQIAGVTSLIARIHVSLFPRLGVLMAQARLLIGGADFLDRVSIIGEVSLCVWDVNWGSTFPCANGSVSQIITNYALSGLGAKTINVPDRVVKVVQDQQTNESSTNGPGKASHGRAPTIEVQRRKARFHPLLAGFAETLKKLEKVNKPPGARILREAPAWTSISQRKVFIPSVSNAPRA